MDVRRRGLARVLTATAGSVLGLGLVLAGPAAAQEAPPPGDGTVAEEDPCAPGPDGSVPEMCQSGPAPEPKPEEDPCPPQPVEPGDGQVSEPDQGIAVGEPAPGTDPSTDPGLEPEPVPAEHQGEPAPEPAPEETVTEPGTDGEPVAGPPPGMVGDDGLICAFAAPVADSAAVPESAAGGVTSTNAATASGALPRTGTQEQLLALALAGGALVLAGAGATLAGRRQEP